MLAAKDLGFSLPREPPWWQSFGVELAEAEQIALEMRRLYGKRPPAYVEVPRQVLKGPLGAAGFPYLPLFPHLVEFLDSIGFCTICKDCATHPQPPTPTGGELKVTIVGAHHLHVARLKRRRGR